MLQQTLGVCLGALPSSTDAERAHLQASEVPAQTAHGAAHNRATQGAPWSQAV